jgi:hypothetical protein
MQMTQSCYLRLSNSHCNISSSTQRKKSLPRALLLATASRSTCIYYSLRKVIHPVECIIASDAASVTIVCSQSMLGRMLRKLIVVEKYRAMKFSCSEVATAISNVGVILLTLCRKLATICGSQISE